MAKVLSPGGRFFATIYENPRGKSYLGDIQQSQRVTSHYDRDSYHYDLETLSALGLLPGRGDTRRPEPPPASTQRVYRGIWVN